MALRCPRCFDQRHKGIMVSTNFTSVGHIGEYPDEKRKREYDERYEKEQSEKKSEKLKAATAPRVVDMQHSSSSAAFGEKLVKDHPFLILGLLIAIPALFVFKGLTFVISLAIGLLVLSFASGFLINPALTWVAIVPFAVPGLLYIVSCTISFFDRKKTTFDLGVDLFGYGLIGSAVIAVALKYLCLFISKSIKN